MPTLHIFGGGGLVLTASELAMKSGWRTVLRTSPRIWDPDSDLSRRLEALGVTVVLATELADAMAEGSAPSSGDMALSFGAPWIFPTAWIELWSGRAFNHHPRRLPEHRGGGGASWLVMMGERRGMALLHRLTVGVDEGPVVASMPFVFSPACRTSDDIDTETHLFSTRLLEEWLPQALSKGFVGSGGAQPPYLSSYWPRLSTSIHGWIDWSWEAEDIVRFCDAFDRPYPGAQTFVRGEVVSLQDVTIGELRFFHPFQRGLIFRVSRSEIHVAARCGSLIISHLSLQNGVLTPRVGDRMFTPQHVLEVALASRVTYHPDGSISSSLAGPTSPSDGRR
jgi:methionyl-tRNA formyltransferase